MSLSTPAPLTAEEAIELLNLEILPYEGGCFRETYRSKTTIPAGALPAPREQAVRNHSTQIYYLLRGDQTSALHRVRSDEVFHHYLGDPVQQLMIDVTNESAPKASEWVIGSDLRAGQRPQRVVEAGIWQGASLAPNPVHGFALLGCTVAPGFDWDDFELITESAAQSLATLLPLSADLIQRLTPVLGRTRA